MANAEDYLKFLFKYVLENNKEDMQFFDERVKKGQIEYITRILNSDFKRVHYSDAVKIL
jgi:asparaginyl-tRNA synthetase